jgi:hypothetical protein
VRRKLLHILENDLPVGQGLVPAGSRYEGNNSRSGIFTSMAIPGDEYDLREHEISACAWLQIGSLCYL